MNVSAFNIAEEPCSKQKMSQTYEKAKQALDPEFDWSDLDRIFKVANANRKLFAQFKASDLEGYFSLWVANYHSFTLRSQKKAEPKRTCSDPSLSSFRPPRITRIRKRFKRNFIIICSCPPKTSKAIS